MSLRVALMAVAVTAAGCSPSGAGPPELPLQVRFTNDETAFEAPPAPQYTVPFDVVTADMDRDGDADLLVNWHNLARLELFDNRGGRFVLANPAGQDRSGLYENADIADIYAPLEETLARARAAGPGVYLWHDLDRRGDWFFWVAPADVPVTLNLRANRTLTPRLDRRFVHQTDPFEADLVIDAPTRFRVGVDFVATQLAVEASLPIHVGAGLAAVGTSTDLWKDDPHGIAWVDVRGSPPPEVFVSRGGLMGELRPPYDAKRDRFFEYTGGDPLYRDIRGLMPSNYGRGRRVEWVDIDGDGVNELYVGNTDTPNALLIVGDDGSYRDEAAAMGLDFIAGDTFAWLDVDGDRRDDLVFVDENGFSVAHNRGDRRFEIGSGADLGLHFPAGSELQQEALFEALSLYVLDYDADGRLDLWLAGHGADRRQALYRATGGGFRDVTSAVGLDGLSLTNSVVFLDVENDGYPDAMAYGQRAVWLRNERGARFAIEEVDAGWGLREFTRAVALDVDGDRRDDVAMFGHRRMVARNDTSGGGDALWVRLRGSRGDPVGTVVTAFYANGMARAQRFGSAASTQYSQGSGPLRFGVPVGSQIERLEIRWSDGSVEQRAVMPGEKDMELHR